MLPLCIVYWTLPIAASFQQRVDSSSSSRRSPRSWSASRLGLITQRSVATPPPLIPEPNPHAPTDAVSSSGVNYETVMHAIHQLYSAQNLDERNAISRKDGYWPYIQKGNDPPKELTYGEFDFYFFAELIDRAVAWMDGSCLYNASHPVVFCDLGSGTGRLVLAAAALHPDWQTCRGIELLPGISDVAMESLESFTNPMNDRSNLNESNVAPLSQIDLYLEHDAALETNITTIDQTLRMAPVEFTCGSFLDPYVYFGDANIVFVFSSCMDSDFIQNGLAPAIGRQCKPGTIVITTDTQLPLNGHSMPPVARGGLGDDRIPSGPFELRLLETRDGYCWLTGGSCTAYIYQVVSSLWTKDQGRMDPPILSLQDIAFEVVRALEAGELTDTPAFLRNVYNNMIFYGLPFIPNHRLST